MGVTRNYTTILHPSLRCLNHSIVNKPDDVNILVYFLHRSVNSNYRLISVVKRNVFKPTATFGGCRPNLQVRNKNFGFRYNSVKIKADCQPLSATITCAIKVEQLFPFATSAKTRLLHDKRFTSKIYIYDPKVKKNWQQVTFIILMTTFKFNAFNLLLERIY